MKKHAKIGSKFPKLKCVFLAILLLCILPQYIACTRESSPYRIYAYGSPNSSICIHSKQTLSSLIEEEAFVFYDLKEKEHGWRLLEIYYLLSPLLKCVSCSGEIMPVAPLAGVFYNNRLVAVVILTYPYNEIFWEELIINSSEWRSARLFIQESDGNIWRSAIRDEELSGKLQRLFIVEQVSLPPEFRAINVYDALPLVVGLALADSVNPCTFAIFTALLLVMLPTFGRRKTVLTGLSFVLAVYLTYYLLGLGLVKALATIPYVKQIISILGLLVAADSVRRGLRKSFKSPIPTSLKRKLGILVENSLNPPMGFIAGFLCTMTLLPCSGGPLLVALAILTGLREQIYFILAIYNLIFVLPLLVILVITCSLLVSKRRIKMFRSRRLRLLELVSGILLATISIYTLLIP